MTDPLIERLRRWRDASYSESRATLTEAIEALARLEGERDRRVDSAYHSQQIGAAILRAETAEKERDEARELIEQFDASNRASNKSRRELVKEYHETEAQLSEAVKVLRQIAADCRATEPRDTNVTYQDAEALNEQAARSYLDKQGGTDGTRPERFTGWRESDPESQEDGE